MLIAEHSICQPGRPGPIDVVPRRLAFLRTLPEGEVTHIVLAVLVGLDPLADTQLVRVEAREAPVRGP